MNKGISIIIVSVIIGLVLFDSAQQKYYLDTFNLSPTEGISYITLLKTHLIRWAFWAGTVFPLSYFMWSRYFRPSELALKSWISIVLFYIGGTVLTLLLISAHAIHEQEASTVEFGEFFEFFVFQKGLSFLMASLMLVLLLYNQTKSEKIKNQVVEIRNLQRKKSDLEEVLSNAETPHLQIKIGYKMIPVALEDIAWIQSDDYCVKIHTDEQTYTLRQSLKTLEAKLAPHRFIRIHRSALLNLNYLDQINFETSKITLRNKTEIPYSKSGIKSLKERMTDITT